MEQNTTGENNEDVSPALNPPKIVSAKEATELVAGLMTQRRKELESKVCEAEERLHDAKLLLQELEDGLKGKSSEHPAFGMCVCRWSDKRLLSNGEIVIIEQGDDDYTQPDSICGFVRRVEESLQGFRFSDAVELHREQWEEMQAESYSDYE